MNSKLPEITKRLNCKEDLPWHWLHMELLQTSSREIYQITSTFNQCVLPVMTYGAEALSLTQAPPIIRRIDQRRMERSLLGLTLIACLKSNWLGHVATMNYGQWIRKKKEWRLGPVKRNKGRPLTRWTDIV